MRRYAPLAVVAALGAVVALLSLGTTSRTSGEVGPGRVEVSARFRLPGRTALLVPPLGTVSAATHRAPLSLRAQVVQLDVERLETLVVGDRPGIALRNEAGADVGPLARRLIVRSLVVSVLAGAVAGALVPRRRPATIAAGALGAGVVVAALLGAVWRDFEPEAFQEARYDGALAQAPQIARTVRRHVEGFEAVRTRVDALGQQVASLYAATTTERVAASSGETLILHVSDLHSNPLGLEIVAELARQFRVDAVLDTGDITSFGASVEAEVARLIEQVPAPYYLVPGNHDSPTNRRTFNALESIEVLNGRIARVGEVRILGVGDPNYTADNELTREEVEAGLIRQQPRIRALVAREQPDVLAVHNPRQGEAVAGEVPLVVAGHIHRRTFEELDGTIVVTSGSTGATGIGSFATPDVERYEAQILRFVGSELVAVDAVEMDGIGGSFRIERRLVDPPITPTGAEPEEEAEEEPEEEPEAEDAEPAEGDASQTRSRISPAAVQGSISRATTRWYRRS